MDRWQPGSTPISNRARSVIISRRSGSDLGEANASPNYWRLTGNSEVTGEDRVHDSTWKSVSDRQHVPIRQSRSDVHEARHFVSWSSRLRDFSARACAI